MIEHLVFLLEEPSAQDFLTRLLIGIVPNEVQIHYMVFEGKQDLEAGHPNAIIRIACKELESFFVGDWIAVSEGFNMPSLAKNSNSAKYRNPDLLGSPSAEIARIIKHYQKREGARKISPYLKFDRNKSNSFRVLVSTLHKLFPNTQNP